MKYLLALAILLMTCGTSMAGMVRLGWTFEGTGHKGFRLYYGKTSHVDIERAINPPNPNPYDMTEEILDPNARSHEILVPDGTWFFRLTTIGEQGDSAFTEKEPMATVGIDPPGNFEVEWIITKTKPKEGTP